MKIFVSFAIGILFYILYYWTSISNMMFKDAVLNKRKYTDSYIAVKVLMAALISMGIYLLYT